MLDEEPYNYLRRRLVKLEQAITGEQWTNWLVKQDLNRMLKTVKTEFTQLDRELVNCRRTRKYTSTYASIEESCETMLNSLERRVTWARLL